MFDNDCYCKPNRACSKPVIALIIALITFVVGILVGALTGIFSFPQWSRAPVPQGLRPVPSRNGSGDDDKKTGPPGI